MRLPAKIGWLLLWITCVAGDCQGPPPSMEREILTNSWSDQSYARGTRATYKCRPGYRSLGSIVRVCQDGKWEALNPNRTCQKRPCGHPGDIPFGSFHLENEDTFLYGAKVVYTCDEGYQLLGRNYRECDADGWTNDVPICEVVKCAPVAEPKNGKIVGVLDKDSEFSYGQVVRFECDSGFKLDGLKEIHCSTNGSWSVPVPRCVEISCKSPEVLNGSPISTKQIYKENERFQYICNKGYNFGERGDAKCTKFGWSPSPSCKEVTCIIPNIPDSNFRPDKRVYKGDEEVTYRCKSNFHPQEARTKCTSTGWVPYPKCTEKPCDFPTIRHGHLYHEEYYKPYFPVTIGKYYRYYCDRDFVPFSKSSWHYITCTERGWEPKVPCIRKCIFYSLHSRTTKTFYQGESMRAECPDGLSLPNGETIMTCTESGWSPEPRCVRVKTCSQLEMTIEKGFFLEKSFKYSLNQQARYQCKDGYVTASGETSGSITCRETGWSARPVCIKSCDRPPFENAISKQNGTRFKLHDQLEYECKPGYENREGRTAGSIVCEHNGWSDRPACFERECDVPNLDANIIANPRKQKYKVGEVLKFSCKKKIFERVGPDSVQCYHFGWSPNLPTCKERVKHCNLLPSLLNGNSSEVEKNVYKHGDTVEYVCNPGYLMKGVNKIQCVDGEWTDLPLCIAEERTCKDKPELVNGFAEPSVPPYHHGDSLTFTCTDNFTMIGQSSVMCFLGNWTQLPECIATTELKRCTRKATIFSSNPSLSFKNVFNHNENVSYTCDEGSEMKSSTCINGRWDPEPEINCKGVPKKICPPPPQIPNTQNMTTTVNYEEGDKISILCQDNFLLQLSEEIECKNGTWQSIPHCVEKVPCPQPPQIEHGTTVPASSSLEPNVYPHGSVLNYTCEAGFRIPEEDNGITCSMGNWSSPPQCVGLPCENPPRISHGEILYKSDGYKHGEEATYSCTEGYGIDGPAAIICLKGKWSNPPECIESNCLSIPEISNATPIGPKKKSYKSGEMVAFQCSPPYHLDGPNFAQCINSKWIGGPICRDASCGEPPIVENAIVRNKKLRYSPDERVRYECQRPFEIHGDIEVRCSNGNWTEPPQCKDPKGKCGRPPPIENGDITSFPLTEYPSESTVEYKCQNLYRLEGARTIVCHYGRWSDPPKCLKPCIISEESMDEHKIMLRWKDKKKLYSVIGDSVEFICKSGYYKATPPESFRATCIEGRMTYPSCQ